MIITRTPFRLSLLGGGSDFPEHFHEHGGAVLLSTIDRYSYITVHHLGPFFAHRIGVSYARTERVGRPEEIVHPLVRESLALLAMDEEIEIHHVADLPGRTGLGGSSSFCVGLLHALHAHRGEPVDPEMLAAEAIEVERGRVGDPGGHQDQLAAAHGGSLFIDFPQDGSARVERLALAPERRRQLEERLLLVYLGVARSAFDLLRVQLERTRDNAAALGRVAALARAGREILVDDSQPIDELGCLLDESWGLKSKLAAGITNDRIDEAYSRARAAGAIGGKVLGAGGRGFLLIWAEPERRPEVLQALAPLTAIPFRLADTGSEIIFTTKDRQ